MIAPTRFPWFLLATLAWSNGVTGAEEWKLMARHGECSGLEILQRKFPEIGAIETPDDFISFLRDSHRPAEIKSLDPHGHAIQVSVTGSDIGVIFVRSSLCQTVEH